jgi:hypothetical protein
MGVEKAAGRAGFSVGYFIHAPAKICVAAVRWSTAQIDHAVGGVSRRAVFKSHECSAIPHGRNSSLMRRRHLHISKQEASMIRLLAALIAVMALIGLGTAAAIKPKIFAAVEPVAALPTSTISIEELHRQVDMSTLPVTEIKDLY